MEKKNILLLILLGIAICSSIILSNSNVDISIIDPQSFNGTTLDVNVTNDNLNINVTSTPINTNFYLEVAKGNVAGHSIVNKFGHNPSATAGGEDVWGGGGIYDFYPTVAQTMEAVSTDNDDALGDTGANVMIVFGLNSTWHEVSEYVNLTGTTPVALKHTYIRMYRASIISVGSSESNEGDIIVRVVGGGTTGAFISTNDGQTQQAIYTIPKGKTGYFIKGYVALANDNKNGEDGTFQWKARLNNGFTGAWAVKGQMSLVNIGSSHWQYEYGAPSGGIPEKTDVRLTMTTASTTMDIVGGFDLILVDNDLVSI